MRLTLEELSQRLGLEPVRVRRLADAGAILRDPDGAFAPGDVHRIRLLAAFEAAGVPMDALGAAYRSGEVTFAFYDRLHPEPGSGSARAYAAFAASLGPDAAHLGPLFSAVGLAEPDPGTRLGTAEEALLADLVTALAATERPALVLRLMRIVGENARRAAEASLGLYAEAVESYGEAARRLSFDEYMARYLRPWADLARLLPAATGWLAERHLTHAIDAFSVQETEGVLERAGHVPPREDTPPAVAFVDLAGFTRLTHERGDEFGARLAIRLGEVAAEAVRPHGGRVVKLLGDGVLLRFDAAATAVDGVLELLDAMRAAGLPPGHAGVTSGPVVARDGDVFGRTVNLAARLSDAAGEGQLLVPAALAPSLADRGLRLAPAGTRRLHGVGEVELVAVARA
jgi:class 3 adenylate cyclase